MKSELKTITPQWAAKTLAEKNIGNRALNRAHVEFLANEIRRGTWKVTGFPIVMNAERLVDGQHRLAAVVKAGLSIQTFVADNIPSDVFDAIDNGRRRSTGDTLGVRGEKSGDQLSSALILIDRYLKGRTHERGSYSNTEIVELLERHPAARKSVQAGHRKALLSPSVLAACHYLFSRIDSVLAEEFVDKVTRGAGLEEGSPWHLLRERLVKNSVSTAKLDRQHLMALCIKAWNAVRIGTKPRSIRWLENAAEKFPTIL